MAWEYLFPKDLEAARRAFEEQIEERKEIEVERIGDTFLAWEAGGGMSSTGWARIITDTYGRPLPAVRIRKSGHVACKQHALVPVDVGFYVVEAYRHGNDYTISVYEVTGFTCEGERWKAVLRLIGYYKRGRWVRELPAVPLPLYVAIEASKVKTQIYHCRRAVYAAVLHLTLMGKRMKVIELMGSGGEEHDG